MSDDCGEVGWNSTLCHIQWDLDHRQEPDGGIPKLTSSNGISGASFWANIENVLDGLCARARHQQIYFLWRPHLSDPKDDHILELAVASGTRTVVTHNTKHFRGATSFGVRAVTPKQLLEDLK